MPRVSRQSHLSANDTNVGFLSAERVLQRLRGVRGQGDATETGRRATPQTIADIVRNKVSRMFSL